MNSTDFETLVKTCFSRCPFCLVENSMEFEWGATIPKEMSCTNCGARWRLLFGLNGTWRLLGATLVDLGSTMKSSKLKEKMFSEEFWQKAVKEGLTEKPLVLRKEKPSVAEKVVIIREVVKIRCPYCGGLYDEVKDRCPYCGGKR